MLSRHFVGSTQSILPLCRVARSLYWLTQKARWDEKLTVEPTGHCGFSIGGKEGRQITEQETRL